MNRGKNIFKDFAHNLKLVAMLLDTQKLKVFIMILLSLACMCIGTIIPYIWGQITNGLFYGLQNNIIKQSSIEFDNVIILIGILLILYLIEFVLSLLEKLISTKVANSITYELRKKLIHKINYLPISYHERKNTGDVLSRIINDVETVGNITTSIFVDITTTASLLIAGLVMMFIIQPILASLSIILIPISYVFIKFIVSFSQKHYNRQTENLGQINSYIEESISGLSVINTFNQQKSFNDEFVALNNNYYNESFRSQIINLLTRPVMLIIENLSYIISIVVGAFLCMMGTLTVGDIVAFTQYLNKVISPIQSIMGFSDSMQLMAASAKRIFDYLNQDDEKNVEKGDSKIDFNIEKCTPMIKASNVSFSYDKNNNVIEDFNLEIYKGQTIAIVGPTGSGKTTIIKLLLKYYDDYTGEIYIGNTNIKNISKNELREQFAIVFQRVWVFFETIANNIRYGNLNAKDKDIVKVSKLTNVHDFVVKMNENYNTKISENGSNLSNGQKQLIAIARALISNKEIIILDEATSSVDSKTEEKIYKAFDKTIKNKTAIVIAHRLSTVKKADKIIVLNHGKIEEEGTHDELLKKRGFYYDLYTSGIGTTN